MLLFYNVKGSHHSHLKPHVADKYWDVHTIRFSSGCHARITNGGRATNWHQSYAWRIPLTPPSHDCQSHPKSIIPSIHQFFPCECKNQVSGMGTRELTTDGNLLLPMFPTTTFSSAMILGPFLTRTARLRLELCELVSSLSDSPWTVVVQAALSCIESSCSTTTCSVYVILVCDLYEFVKEHIKYVFFWLQC